MRLLPPDRRNALFAVYALARRIDDIADGDARRGGQARGARGRPRGARAPRRRRRPRARRASPTRRTRFPIPVERVRRARRRRRDGRARDRVRDVRRARALLPLRRRLDRPPLARCLRLLGPRSRAGPLADELGIALQIGNILRDVSEDAANGRVYLPREDLERFGCRGGGRRVRGPIELVIAFEAERGLGRLRTGLDLVPLLDRRSASCVLAMAGKYRRLLERIAAEPGARPAGPALAAVVGEGARARPQPRRGRGMTKVAVVGGGLAGLSAADRVRRRRRRR